MAKEIPDTDMLPDIMPVMGRRKGEVKVQTGIRLPEDLRAELAAAGAENERSANAQAVFILREWLARRKRSRKKVEEE
jgi:hypothetical protein